MKKRMRFLVVVVAIAMLAAACTGDEGEQGSGPVGQNPPAAGNYPRNETLYTSGTQWGPPASWNPLQECCYATGTLGLVYETLFTYDPLTDEFTPWLAESGDWTSDTEYEVKLREGINWTDGEPFTADDVVFTTELGKIPAVPYSTLWNWLEGVEAVDDYTVKFTFSEPLYQEWANFLYTRPILPEHLWGDLSDDEVATGANENPIGTGSYLYETSDQDRMVWVKNEDWWAKDQLGLDVKPKYIVDIVNGSNNVALGLILQGGIDLSNNFLPGIATLIDGGYGIQTYFPDAPFMLSANTAWLVLNTTKPPMDDPEFRRALAFSIDTDKIVSSVYGDIVQAANPTGLLPIWDKYVDQSVVDDLGFEFDPAEAKRILGDAGYEDTNGDGFVEAPDGSEIDLQLSVPDGWTDWMEAIRTIASSAEEAGIKITTDFPDYNALVDARNSGQFDLVINNDKQIANTPWTYYDFIFRLPIQDSQTTTNFGRFESQEAWDLVQQLDKTPVDDLKGMQAIASKLQTIQLEEMPLIPLWYNGLWSQANTTTWTNWPSSAEDANHYLPATWRGYWNMTGTMTLTELEPAPSE